MLAEHCRQTNEALANLQKLLLHRAVIANAVKQDPVSFLLLNIL